MKSPWKEEPFEACIDKVTYTTKIQRTEFLAEGDYPIVSQEEEFINGYWDKPADLFRVDRPVVVFGDHTKVLKYVDFDFVLGADGVKVLRPKDFLLPRFFYYQLQTADLKSLGYARHYRLLKELKVAYPSLPEQRRIVGILDEAFEGIASAKANAEKNLQNAGAVFESHLQSIFNQRENGWRRERFGELATFRNGINFTKASRGDSIKIVGVADFQNNYWAPLDSLDSVVTDGAVPDADLLREDDILFVRSNGNPELIGRCLLVGKVLERISFSGFTIRARLNSAAVTTKYLCHFLRAGEARREMINGGNGVNIKSLNQTTLSELTIPVPPLPEQTRIVRQIEAISAEADRLASIYEQKLAALGELKKSLLHQAFSGEL